MSPEDERLFDALRSHRMELARTEAVPPYVVASDRTLREVAELRPRSRMELLDTHGIGDAKADKYGEGFLAIVRDHSPESVASGVASLAWASARSASSSTRSSSSLNSDE